MVDAASVATPIMHISRSHDLLRAVNFASSKKPITRKYGRRTELFTTRAEKRWFYSLAMSNAQSFLARGTHRLPHPRVIEAHRLSPYQSSTEIGCCSRLHDSRSEIILHLVTLDRGTSTRRLPVLSRGEDLPMLDTCPPAPASQHYVQRISPERSQNPGVSGRTHTSL